MGKVNKTPVLPNIRIFPQMQEEDNIIDISSDSETYTMHKRLLPTRFTW